MIIGQLGTWLTAWLAYAYEWQYVYHFMMAFMLAGIIIVFFTMPYHEYPMPEVPDNDVEVWQCHGVQHHALFVCLRHGFR